MGIKLEKRPWNPFPLASLKVEGLTACAKSVLIYLAARSNHKGETCVGHRTMCRELVRSKDFVTKGLQELINKKIIAATDRNRSKQEAMWRAISPSVLKSRTKEEGDQSCPAGHVSPEEQDFVSPAQQGETLQISSTNLADENLTEPVSERVSEDSAPVATLPPRCTETPAEKPTKTLEDHDREMAQEQQWLSAEDLYHQMFPGKLWADEDIQQLVSLAEEVGGHRGITYGGERVRAAWEWNQAHKKGKYKLFSLRELANALHSTSDRSLLAQMDADEGCPLCQ